MNKRWWKVVGWLVVLVTVLSIGTVAGGGAAYALNRVDNGAATAAAPAAQINPEPGILVASVLPDTGAAEAGLVRGDIILAADGQEVNQPVELRQYLAGLAPGDEVTLTVLHGDDERSLTVTLGDRAGRAHLGFIPAVLPHAMALSKVSEADATEFDFEVEHILDGARARIMSVTPAGPAEQAGLQAGDLIKAVDGQALDPDHDLAAIIAGYQPGDTVALTITRPDEEDEEVSVTLAEHPDEAGKAFLGIAYGPAGSIFFSEKDNGEQGHYFRFSPPSFRRPFRDFDHMPFRSDESFLPEGVEQGAVIRGVAADSPAAEAGLNEEDIITAIDGEPLWGPRDLAETVTGRQPGEVLTLTVIGPEGEAERDVQVTLAGHPDEADKAYLGVQTGGFFRMQRFVGPDGKDITEDRTIIIEGLPLEDDITMPEFDFESMPGLPHDDMIWFGDGSL